MVVNHDYRTHFCDRKTRFGQSETQFYFNKKAFVDHQQTGVFIRVEEAKSQKLDILAELNKKKEKNNGQLYILMGHSLYFRKKNHVFLSLKIVFVFANSTDPNQMPHLGLYCLPKYGFRSQ